MNKKELKQITKLASSDAVLPGFYDQELDPLMGIAAHKDRVWCSREAFSALIRGMCRNLDGSWDNKEMPEIESWSKRVDLTN